MTDFGRVFPVMGSKGTTGDAVQRTKQGARATSMSLPGHSITTEGRSWGGGVGGRGIGYGKVAERYYSLFVEEKYRGKGLLGDTSGEGVEGKKRRRRVSGSHVKREEGCPMVRTLCVIQADDKVSKGRKVCFRVGESGREAALGGAEGSLLWASDLGGIAWEWGFSKRGSMVGEKLKETGKEEETRLNKSTLSTKGTHRRGSLWGLPDGGKVISGRIDRFRGGPLKIRTNTSILILGRT